MKAYLPAHGSSHISTWKLICLHLEATCLQMEAHTPTAGSSFPQTGTVMSVNCWQQLLCPLSYHNAQQHAFTVSPSQLKCVVGACLLLLKCCKAQCTGAMLQVALLPWRTARMPSPTWANHWHKPRPSSWRPPMSWCQLSSCVALCRTPSSIKSPSWHSQTRSSTIVCCIADRCVLPHAALPCLVLSCLV